MTTSKHRFAAKYPLPGRRTAAWSSARQTFAKLLSLVSNSCISATPFYTVSSLLSLDRRVCRLVEQPGGNAGTPPLYDFCLFCQK